MAGPDALLVKFFDVGPQLGEIDRLAQILVRALAHSGHSGFDRGVSGNHDDFGIGPPLTQFLQKLHAVHAVHLEIRHHHVGGLPFHGGNSFQAIAHGLHFIAVGFEYYRQVLSGDVFIIHNENAGGAACAEILDREEFKDTILDALQTEMTVVEDLFGPDDIEIVLGGRVPGEERMTSKKFKLMAYSGEE